MSREDARLDCPRPECFGWLVKVVTADGNKLKCSDSNCRQTTIFSRRFGECSFCAGAIHVGDVLTHVDSPTRGYPIWVHVTCFMNPPQTLRTCLRCGAHVEEVDAIEDSTGILHRACLTEKRRRAMAEGSPVPTIVTPKLKKKPIDPKDLFPSPGATSSSSQDDA
jgi:hypothetical protein